MRDTRTCACALAIVVALALAPTHALADTTKDTMATTATTELYVETNQDKGSTDGGTAEQIRRTVTGPMPTTGDKGQGSTLAGALASVAAAAALAAIANKNTQAINERQVIEAGNETEDGSGNGERH